MVEILTLGEKIKRRRKAMQLTLKDVAGDYMTPAQLSYIESNKCSPSISMLKYICNRLGLDTQYVTEPEIKQAERCCRIYMDEYESMMKRGEYREADTRLTEVEELSKMYGIDKYAAIALYKRGMHYMETGDDDLAEENFLKAANLFAKLDCGEYMAECFCNLGSISLMRGYTENATAFLHQALEALEHGKVADNYLHYTICHSLARAYRCTGEKKEFEKYIEIAMDDVRMIGDYEKEFRFLCDAAMMSYDISGPDMAKRFIENAMEIKYNVNGDYYGAILTVLSSLIDIKNGECKEGANHIESVLTEIKGTVDSDVTDYLLVLAGSLATEGYREHASTILDWLEDTIGEDNPLYARIMCIRSILCRENDADSAERYLLKSMTGLDGAQNSRIKAWVAVALGDLYASCGKYGDAFKYLMEGANMHLNHVN